jgi:hypothetical protein
LYRYFETAVFDPTCRFVPTFQHLNAVLQTVTPCALDTKQSGEKAAVSGEKAAVVGSKTAVAL